MGDLFKAIEYLGIPMTVSIVLVVIFLAFQIIGEIVEFFGKVVPEFFKVRKYFKRKKQEKQEAKQKATETAQTLAEVKQLLSDVNSHYSKDNITKRNNWMQGVDQSVENNEKLIQTLGGKMDKILESHEHLKNELGQVKSNVLENEADRLRAELFDCGNRCRRNIRLHPEEMEHIRVVFNKYSNVLHQNGPGEREFNFINDYYNHQNFPDYHQKNN